MHVMVTTCARRPPCCHFITFIGHPLNLEILGVTESGSSIEVPRCFWTTFSAVIRPAIVHTRCEPHGMTAVTGDALMVAEAGGHFITFIGGVRLHHLFRCHSPCHFTLQSAVAHVLSRSCALPWVTFQPDHPRFRYFMTPIQSRNLGSYRVRILDRGLEMLLLFRRHPPCHMTW